MHALKSLTSACFRCVHAARRGFDIADFPTRKYSFGAGIMRDIESPLTQKPFTTISSTISSLENVENAEDEFSMQKQNLQKTLAANNLPLTTTTTISKTDAVVDEENRTPKEKPIPVSTTTTTTTTTTPKTVPIPMNTAMTPAHFGGDLIQDIEYSFEEIRLGFLLA